MRQPGGNAIGDVIVAWTDLQMGMVRMRVMMLGPSFEAKGG